MDLLKRNDDLLATGRRWGKARGPNKWAAERPGRGARTVTHMGRGSSSPHHGSTEAPVVRIAERATGRR